MCYVGSTVQPLSKRMEVHRSTYKKYLDGIHHYVSVFDLFDEYGVLNCKIELVESYSCNSKEGLHGKEGIVQRECDCVNKRVAGRSKKQYYEDNKLKMDKYRQEYYEEHKDRIKTYLQQYYKDNKEQIQEVSKYYRAKLSQCECGSSFRTCVKARHNKSLKHQEYLKSLETMDSIIYNTYLNVNIYILYTNYMVKHFEIVDVGSENNEAPKEVE